MLAANLGFWGIFGYWDFVLFDFLISGDWNLDLGIWNLEFGIWNLEFRTWNLELGIWKLKAGNWLLGIGGNSATI